MEPVFVINEGENSKNLYVLPAFRLIKESYTQDKTNLCLDLI